MALFRLLGELFGGGSLYDNYERYLVEEKGFTPEEAAELAKIAEREELPFSIENDPDYDFDEP